MFGVIDLSLSLLSRIQALTRQNEGTAKAKNRTSEELHRLQKQVEKLTTQYETESQTRRAAQEDLRDKTNRLVRAQTEVKTLRAKLEKVVSSPERSRSTTPTSSSSQKQQQPVAVVEDDRVTELHCELAGMMAFSEELESQLTRSMNELEKARKELSEMSKAYSVLETEYTDYIQLQEVETVECLPSLTIL